MTQKFPELTFVRIDVDAKLNPEMSHFDTGFDAIIEGSYAQLYGGGDTKSYSVYKLHEGVIVNNVAWYEEHQITALSKSLQNKRKAKKLIEKFNHECGIYG
jgi:hypothetical protein